VVLEVVVVVEDRAFLYFMRASMRLVDGS
jgi:hypothetical protein